MDHGRGGGPILLWWLLPPGDPAGFFEGRNMKQATTTEFEGAAAIAVAGDKPYAGKFWTIDFIPVRPRFAGEKITEFYDSRQLRDRTFSGLPTAMRAA